MAMPRTLYQKIIKALEAKGPLSLPELHALVSDYTYKALFDTLQQARGLKEGEVKTVYVKDYKRQDGKGGKPSPIFALGNEPDVEPLKAVPRRDNWMKYNSKPDVKARRVEHNRQARIKQKQAKQAARNVFRMMATPVEPIELEVVNVTVHEMYDDEPLRKRPRGPYNKTKAEAQTA